MATGRLMLRAVAYLALAVAVSCVAPQLRKGCPAACDKGQSCDPRYGLCRDDPCGGACAPGERCRAGPPPRCTRLMMGEVEENGSTFNAPGDGPGNGGSP
jgi:hypothetical protein